MMLLQLCESESLMAGILTCKEEWHLARLGWIGVPN